MSASLAYSVPRITTVARHQAVLLARDPGPMIGYTVMGLLLMTATRSLYAVVAPLVPAADLQYLRMGRIIRKDAASHDPWHYPRLVSRP